MKLISLELQNFRQHRDTQIAFTDGVTGIIGPNGSGKSTILEGIAWALYGAPAVRGTNDTIRSMACEGGAKARASLTFELGGQVYQVSRSLDGAGRGAQATLEVEGRALRSGMSEVSVAVAKLLDMDYHAFFTSFFTGQKELEFMANLDGRQRAAAISRMLGYDRLTKAREQANKDRLTVHNEITGLELGMGNENELKQRKAAAEERMAETNKALAAAQQAQKAADELVSKLAPLKELLDQKARRHDELARRLELDRADILHGDQRLSDLKHEIQDLSDKQVRFDAIKAQLGQHTEAAERYKALAELQKHEAERQRLSGLISSLQQDVKRLETREKALGSAVETQVKAGALLAEAEVLLADAEKQVQTAREERVARVQSLEARARHLETQAEEIRKKRQQIADAGADGRCPTCERELGEELPIVLSHFGSHLSEVELQINAARGEKTQAEADTAQIDTLEGKRVQLAEQVTGLRADKARADAEASELQCVRDDRLDRETQLAARLTELGALPAGFDQAAFEQLTKLRESLQPVREEASRLRGELERAPRLQEEEATLSASLESRRAEVEANQAALDGLEFSPQEHEDLARQHSEAAAQSHSAALEVTRQQGEVNTAEAVLKAAIDEELNYRSKLEALTEKRARRIYLQALAESFDKLRAELNDRIRPELESIASDLLSVMTDGRYNVLEISETYAATIRDDGELKPVISGGEEDVVNLALRLAVSRMIADRAGQSFSLLVLDEVFGSLDDVRRDNVVALLQNLKNRFEQIILITHVESIHDALDNCLWVQLDERTKTSRLIDRSMMLDRSEVGVS